MSTTSDISIGQISTPVSVDGGSSPSRLQPSVNNNRKRSRDQVEDVQTQTSGSSKPAEDSERAGERLPEKSARGSEDPLVPITKYNWNEFTARCHREFEDVGVEVLRLLEEYRQWEWIHELWSQARSVSDQRRLSQEIDTIVRWTALKEAELEEARLEHTNSMLAISRVLGIVPK